MPVFHLLIGLVGKTGRRCFKALLLKKMAQSAYIQGNTMSIYPRAIMSAHVALLRCILKNTSSNPIAAGRLSDVENAGEE